MKCPRCETANLPGSDQCRHCGLDLTPLDRPAPRDRIERSLMNDRVGHLKPRQAVTLPPDATVERAIATMLEHDIGAVLVVEAGKLVGIFSERDLLTKVAGNDLGYATRPVRDYMTVHPQTVRENDTLAFVLHKMDGGGYRHLPVIKDGQPLGMISVRDMLRHITRLCKDV